MWKSIRTELWKAIHNPMFYAAVCIGILITMVNVAENAAVVKSITARILDYIQSGGTTLSTHYEACSLFVQWIAVKCASLGYNIFYFVWPILAAMPFGWSYYLERRSGVFNQIITRCGRRMYYIAKYIAVFVSGGLAIAIPILVNLLVNALVCPYCVPNVLTLAAAVFDGNFLSELFYTRPWMYAFIWCGMEFLWGGVTACVCFLAGTKLRLQVMVVLTPFALYLCLDGLYNLADNLRKLHFALSPLKLAAASTGNQNPEWAVFSVLGILFVGTVIAGYWQVVHRELS